MAVQALLEKHPWYTNRWRDENAKLPEAQRSEALFMWAAHWADDIRTQARLQGRSGLVLHPFKPEREPEHIEPLPLHREDMSTAIAENKRRWARASSREKGPLRSPGSFTRRRRASAAAHVQLVTREYPHGDRGGNEIYLQTEPVAPHWTCTAFGPEIVRFG